jgi:hypothetical protein
MGYYKRKQKVWMSRSLFIQGIKRAKQIARKNKNKEEALEEKKKLFEPVYFKPPFGKAFITGWKKKAASVPTVLL